MQNKHPVYDLIAPVIENLGFELVRVMTIGVKKPVLQVMIDRIDGENLVVDDCAKVSRAISEVLDEKDPIEGEYSLEVSSPGIDRPLTKLEHFKRFLGYETKIETDETVDERKRFKGIVKEVKGEVIVFEMDDKIYNIPFEKIAKAKLVLTDELLKEYEQTIE